jgi:hypothetical protein
MGEPERPGTDANNSLMSGSRTGGLFAGSPQRHLPRTVDQRLGRRLQ